MRRKEERSEDVQRAMACVEQGLANGCNPQLAEAIRVLCGLAHEDPYEFVDHVIRAGRKDQSRDDIQDFSVDHVDGQVRAREIYLQDIGDPPELTFGRMGPDGANYNHDAPEEVPAGTPLGLLIWRIWEANGGGWTRRMAQIWARYQGNNDGSLHMATAKDGELVERFAIDGEGTWHFQNVVTTELGGEMRMKATLNGVPVWLVFRRR
jgi:hypothetical protein